MSSSDQDTPVRRARPEWADEDTAEVPPSDVVDDEYDDIRVSTGEFEIFLDQAQEAFRAASEEAAETAGESSDEVVEALRDQGLAYFEQFRLTGESALLQAALASLDKAVESTPPDSPHLPVRLNALGYALLARYRLYENESDLKHAVQVLRRGVGAAPPDSRLRQTTRMNLSTALLEQSRTSRNSAEALRATEFVVRDLQQALASPSTSPSDRDKYLALLSVTHFMRHRAVSEGSSGDSHSDELVRSLEAARAVLVSRSTDATAQPPMMHGHRDPRLARSRVEFAHEPPAAEHQKRSGRVARQSLWRHLRDAIASGGLSLIVRKID